MFILIGAGFMLAYYVGWLPPSVVVPVLFACGFLSRGRPRPRKTRGGFLPPPSSARFSASPGGNPAAAPRAETFTAYSMGGPSRADQATPPTTPPPSSFTGRGGSTSGRSPATGTGGYRGRTPAASADSELTDGF